MSEQDPSMEEIYRLWLECPDILVETFRTLKSPKQGLIDFSLKNRPYLRPVYRSFTPNSYGKTVVLKCGRKVEKSETLTNMILIPMNIYDGFIAIYTTGRQEQVSRFTQERLIESMNSSKGGFFSRNFDGGSPTNYRWTTSLPGIKNHLYSYSAWNEAIALLGIAADLVCVDEVQDIAPGFFEKVKETLRRSEFKWMILSGTARDKGDEFDRIWGLTNQMEWFVTCPSCGHEQSLGDENVMCRKDTDEHGNRSKKLTIETAYIGCKFCRTELNRTEGYWKAMRPDNKYDGYHISQLMVPEITPQEIMECRIEYPPRRYYNEVLGISYEGKARPIPMSLILQNCVAEHPTYKKELKHTLGIDWGTQTTIAIINENYEIVLAEKIEPAGQDEIIAISQIIERFNIDGVGADQGYGARQVKELQAMYDERVNAIQYVSSQREPKRYEPWDSNGNAIYRYYIDKVWFVEETIQRFHNKQFKIPYSPLNLEYEWAVAEIFNIKADDEHKGNRQKFTRYSDDHFFHALAYAAFIMDEGLGVSYSCADVG